jgi:uncharacterized protein (DUF433 family)
MAQTFSYFRADGTVSVREQPGGPLPQSGEVWARGRYDGDVHPSPLNVRVGSAGIKVWMVIHWLALSGGDFDELRQRYGSMLSPDDVAAAKWFYAANKAEIDARIHQESEAA